MLAVNKLTFFAQYVKLNIRGKRQCLHMSKGILLRQILLSTCEHYSFSWFKYMPFISRITKMLFCHSRCFTCTVNMRFTFTVNGSKNLLILTDILPQHGVCLIRINKQISEKRNTLGTQRKVDWKSRLVSISKLSIKRSQAFWWCSCRESSRYLKLLLNKQNIRDILFYVCSNMRLTAV